MSAILKFDFRKRKRKKYTSGPRYWNVPVLVNTGTFLVYQYCLKMWYLCSLERAGAIQKVERKNCLVLANTRVPESGTWSILFPRKQLNFFRRILSKLHKQGTLLHVTITVSLKQGQTRTSSGPIWVRVPLNTMILGWNHTCYLNRSGFKVHLRVTWVINPLVLDFGKWSQ